MKKQINVVGAIIENEAHEILCALRSPLMSLPNLWEFPGGKMELNESINETIEREIQEELLCKVDYLSTFHHNTHEYDNFIINLTTVRCQLKSDSPVATEHSKIIWLKRENLASLNWAPADVPAVKLLIAENI